MCRERNHFLQATSRHKETTSVWTSLHWAWSGRCVNETAETMQSKMMIGYIFTVSGYNLDLQFCLFLYTCFIQINIITKLKVSRYLVSCSLTRSLSLSIRHVPRHSSIFSHTHTRQDGRVSKSGHITSHLNWVIDSRYIFLYKPCRQFRVIWCKNRLHECSDLFKSSTFFNE